MPLHPDFLWGFSTAAAQIEGAGVDSERASGRGDSADAVLATFGVNSYRFSISWPRVIPLGGRDDPINEQGLQFYDDLINELLKHNITPMITLFHWDLPLGLWDRYGGFLNREVIVDFTHYAGLCFSRYADRVKYWLTFNEPWCIAAHGHYHGKFAPTTEPWIVGHHVLLAHATAGKLFQREYKPTHGGTIGITLNGDWTEPYDASEESRVAAQNKMDVAVGWFADPLYLDGEYPAYMRRMLGDKLPSFTEEEKALLHGSSEFFGCNTYTTNTVRPGGTDLAAGLMRLGFDLPDGTEIGTKCESALTPADAASLEWLRCVPWGMHKYLVYLYDRYKLPIYITENGWAGPGESEMTKEEALHDTTRVEYYRGYLENMLLAIADGVDVRSYYAWSFMDNFEWNSGLGPRFGCVHVDYDTFERTPKDSAAFITKFFKEATTPGSTHPPHGTTG